MAHIKISMSCVGRVTNNLPTLCFCEVANHRNLRNMHSWPPSTSLAPYLPPSICSQLHLSFTLSIYRIMVPLMKEGFSVEVIGVTPWVTGWGNVVITQVRMAYACAIFVTLLHISYNSLKLKTHPKVQQFTWQCRTSAWKKTIVFIEGSYWY